ncbi:MAG: MFS transporter [Ramlibacter sp.]|nr:MFS transporter [Ramlibacter sp.]
MSLWIRNEPRDRGLAPDGAPVAQTAHASAALAGMSIRDAVRSRPFIGLYLGCLVSSFGLFVPFAHLVPYATDHGVPPASAVLLLGVIGIGSTAGRLLLGDVADRLGRRRSLLVMFAGMAASLCVWAASGGFAMLAVFALVYGVFYGGYVALLPALVMDAFGGRNVSGIIGILYTSIAFGTLIGPSATGFAFDASGSYTVAILLGAAANLLGAAIVGWGARAGPRAAS